MKIVLAALAAGLLGGSVAIGAVASGLIPLEDIGGKESAPVEFSDSDSPLEDRLIALENRNADLKLRLEELGDRQMDIETKVWDLDDTAATKAELSTKADKSYVDEKTKGVVAAKRATGPAPKVPAERAEFDTAVRDVIGVLRAEEAEQKRLDKQTKRLADLEKRKTQVAEFIPKLLAKQGEKLGIDEATQTTVSATLVQHAQFRLELASEIQEKRIDGEEVDMEAVKQRFSDLDETTLSVLSASVDEETAQKLMKSIKRAGKKGGGERGGRDRGRRR